MTIQSIDFTPGAGEKRLSRIIEQYEGDDILKADGLDDAVIGIDENSMRLVYSSDRIIEILQERDGMTEFEAREFYDFNIAGAYVGDQTPIYIQTEF